MKKSFLPNILLCALVAISSIFIFSACKFIDEKPITGEPESYEFFDFTLLEDGTYAVSLNVSTNMPKEVVFPSVYNEKPVTVIGEKIFFECESIISVTIPEGITTISGRAFVYCTSLESISIPGSVTFIGDEAFLLCDSLKSVVIHKDISYIGKEAFSSCNSLESINVDENNANYKSIDGVLYDKKGRTLICYPEAKNATSFVIPEGVTVIEDYAFNGSVLLQSITFPNSLTTIGVESFYACSALVRIDIGDNVVDIGEGAFASCYSLISVKLGKKVTFIREDAFAFNDRIIEVLNESTRITIVQGDTSHGGIAEYAKFVINSKGEDLESVLITDEKGFITYSENDDVVLVAYIGNEVRIEIPNNVTIINDYAFYYSSRIESVKAPEGVKYIGDYAFYYCDLLTNFVVPDNVTYIGERAFTGCYSLLSLTLGENLEDIGYYAFDACYAVVEVFNKSNHITIAEGNDSLSLLGSFAEFIYNPGDEFTKINFETDDNGFITYNSGNEVILVAYIGDETEIVIPNNVTKIRHYAFYDKNLLESVVVPESVTYIGKNTFEYCEEIKSISLPNRMDYIGECAFAGCSELESIVIPEGITSISEETFSFCSKLKNITIPNSVTSIGDYAFSYCRELENITIPNEVTSIGDCTFYQCEKLKNITIPNGVTSIGEEAFSGCNLLTSIIIPQNVVTIAESAFNACYRLTEVVNKSPHFTVEKGSQANGKIGYYATFVYNSGDKFVKSNLITDQNGFMTYVDGEEVVLVAYFGNALKIEIPNSVTKIANYAFYSYSNIVHVNITDNVTSIGDYAFSHSSVKSVTFGSKLRSIGNYVFNFCSSLEGVTIPASVDRIGAYAFGYCSGMQSIIFEDGENWYRCLNAIQSGGFLTNLADVAKNAEYFTDTYKNYYWYKK